ncbi:MAG: DUF2103 domain-containing protein [Candidatus Pacebacteria bacterium]|nr:DUF2103 domain-containing protein [Candidatus Paceibacterota bacterium]
MRYRKKSKIKKKHDLIKGLEKFLEKIENWPEIQAINPGEIKPRGRKMGSKLAIRIQYKTKSGLKCIARSQGIQEVFLVSSEPEKLEEKIKSKSYAEFS